LLKLLEQREDTLVEFKSYLPRDNEGKNNFAEQAVALANAASLLNQKVAYLVTGVADSGTVVGVTPRTEDRKEIRDFLAAKSEPPVKVLEIHEISIEDVPPENKHDRAKGAVYVLEIEPSYHGPTRYYPDSKQDDRYGGVPIRDGPKVRDSTNEELRTLVLKGASRLVSGQDAGTKSEIEQVRSQLERIASDLLKRPNLEIHFIGPSGERTDHILLRPVYYDVKTVKVDRNHPKYSQLLLFRRTMRISPTLFPSSIFPRPARQPGPATFPVSLIVVNSGAVPASDVRAFFKFPDGFVLENSIEYEQHELFGPAPTFQRTIHGVWKDDEGEDCVEASLHITKLSNGLTCSSLDPIYVTPPNASREYQLDVSLHADYMEASKHKLKITVESSTEIRESFELVE
jgi:hypothetical protein